MLSTPVVIDVPLRTDEHGVIRVGKTRVTLQTVIAAHLQNQSPQQIVEDFDVLKLEEVFAVITYYLTHKDEVDEYIRQQQAAGEKLRRELETKHPEMFVLQEKFRRLFQERNSEDKA
jgi:uncharacterized protein (DUF433 family)